MSDKPLVFTGARARFSIDGTVVGYSTNAEVHDEPALEPNVTVGATIAGEVRRSQDYLAATLETLLFTPMPPLMRSYTRGVPAPCSYCRRTTWAYLDGRPLCTICGRDLATNTTIRALADARMKKLGGGGLVAEVRAESLEHVMGETGYVQARLSGPPPCRACGSTEHGDVAFDPYTYACPLNVELPK